MLSKGLQQHHALLWHGRTRKNPRGGLGRLTKPQINQELTGTGSSGLRLRSFCSVASVGLGTLPVFGISVLEHRGVEASKGDADQRSLRAKAENGTGTGGN